MNREIRYLLLIVGLVCLCITGYFSTQRAAYPALPANPAESQLSGAQQWQGHSILAPLLHVNLDSTLRIARDQSGAQYVTYAVGNTAAVAQAAKLVRSDGMSKLSWSKQDNDYEFVMRDGADAGRLYVMHNRVRYLVLMNQHSAVEASAGQRFFSTLKAVLVEGWQLLSLRMIGLMVTYALIAGLMYAIWWLLLKNRLAQRKIQADWPKKGAVLYEVQHSAIAVVATALFSYGLVFALESGHTKMYREVAEYGWGYWFFSLAVLLVLVDAYVYWTHRLMHHRLLFKYFHKVHHHSTRPTPWATFSVNVNEIIVNAMFMPIVVMLMPVHRNTTIVFGLLSILKNVINHLGYEIFPSLAGKGVMRWVVGPTYHELHHVKFNCNYSAYFTWWDRWMGTEQLNFKETFKKAKPEVAATPEALRKAA